MTQTAQPRGIIAASGLVGSKLAALNQWWTTQTAANLGLTTVGNEDQESKKPDHLL